MAETDLLTPLPATDPKLLARFLAKVQKTDGCWLWTGWKFKSGYGGFDVDDSVLRAHRAAWRLFRGGTNGLQVLHRCDTPPCVRPDHLFLGSQKDNMDDMIAKGRQAVGDRHGSRTHPEAVPRGDRNGSRKHPERLTRGGMHWYRTHPERLIPPVGERNGQAKLNAVAVRVVRWLVAHGAEQWKVGAAYGISQSTVSMAVARVRWKHVS